jgi:hypothetical protein
MFVHQSSFGMYRHILTSTLTLNHRDKTKEGLLGKSLFLRLYVRSLSARPSCSPTKNRSVLSKLVSSKLYFLCRILGNSDISQCNTWSINIAITNCGLWLHRQIKFHAFLEHRILSRVRGSVTNTTGFWIWWSNLLNLYKTGCNSSQITDTLSSSSDWPLHGNYEFWLPSELHRTLLYSIGLLQFSWVCPLITPRHGPQGKHCLLLSRMRVYGSVA